MGTKAEQIRARIIDAADELFYQYGFDNTSFTDIAQAVNISRGNFYYHFKTKDEILKAVVQARCKAIKTTLAHWENEYSDAKQRIHAFINLSLSNKGKIKKYGCPVASLCAELNKVNHAMRDDAKMMLKLFKAWLIKQFKQFMSDDQAYQMTLHLLGRTQGIASMANIYDDIDYIKREVQLLNDWLDSL